METSDPPRKLKPRQWILRGLIAVGLVSVIVGLVSPMDLRAYRDPLQGDWSSLISLSGSLRTYAGENDGKLPDHLEDLGIHRGQWIYFSGFAPTDPQDTILIASSRNFSKADGTRMVGDGPHRMVLSLGGRRFLLKEADYQACIEEQQLPGWTRGEVSYPEAPWGFLSDPAWHASDARALEKEHDASDVPKLVHSLKHGDRTSRRDAAEALGEIGTLTPEVAPALLGALSNSDSGHLAAMGLAAMSLRDESIVPSLIGVLGSDRGKTSYWAAVALKEIGLEDAKTAIPLMIAELGSPGDIKITAAKAIAGAGPEAAAAVPHLIRLTLTGDRWECKCAVIALGRIGPQARDALSVLGAMFDSGHDSQIDIARALWKIDPSQGHGIVPLLIAKLEGQRNPNGPNNQMDNDFYSAMELLGEMGPVSQAAIPILRVNLQGEAKLNAAWALWRIDAGLLESMTPVLASFLKTSTPHYNRLDRHSQGSWVPRHGFHFSDTSFDHPFSSRMAALGALWQMHPEKHKEMNPLLVALLREWERERGLDKLSADTRTAIPAVGNLLDNSSSTDLRILAREALRKIKTTDPGRW